MTARRYLAHKGAWAGGLARKTPVAADLVSETPGPVILRSKIARPPFAWRKISPAAISDAKMPARPALRFEIAARPAFPGFYPPAATRPLFNLSGYLPRSIRQDTFGPATHTARDAGLFFSPRSRPAARVSSGLIFPGCRFRPPARPFPPPAAGLDRG
jgi:hypothetical protein